MKDCKASVAPIIKGDKFHKGQSRENALEQDQMKSVPYASAVGSLMYAQICTRPDICLAVGLLGRYQSNPGLQHWIATKKVMRYLQGTKNYMLTYRHTENLQVVGYSDSDFVGCVDTRKSISGYIFLLAEGAISWKSTKQSIVATSTMEAQFIACYEATTQAIWLKNFISGFKIVDSIQKPIKIICDNTAAVLFSKNNKRGSRSKHIDINYLSVRESIKYNVVYIEHTSTDLMLADLMTKGLSVKQFQGHVDHIGLTKV
ncbi:secreted RxLR effector protein 161-like [Carya illinoinensis]|uniref:secreted RxLR effector protein 161-like n=1 Tax=Carya illinoinensis TaxID=32201 RepID=UPI001C71BB9B|nr:secreted RxLR effector protein 161-like [Carya illinoinensis]